MIHKKLTLLFIASLLVAIFGFIFGLIKSNTFFIVTFGIIIIANWVILSKNIRDEKNYPEANN